MGSIPGAAAVAALISARSHQPWVRAANAPGLQESWVLADVFIPAHLNISKPARFLVL